nr:unnamed protein product [Callosobruchus analis]
MCYAYPAQELTLEASNVRCSAYFSEWNENMEYSRFILMIMIRSQKDVMIAAGGMVRIDLEMFLVVSIQAITNKRFIR